MHPSPLSLQQRDLYLTGSTGEEAESRVHSDAAAVGGWAASMQIQPSAE